ncbi:MAG TPA: KpsF/GutQ family sugar-phosphate isomerase [Planctomycetaceae bacterium]|nr:KpsF/GutQ family sugar-phosphate isomerase [Planctomycetaceae bacterium]
MTTSTARKADLFDAESFGRRVLLREGQALVKQSESLSGPAFIAALDLILGCNGRVIVTGMGKAGIIGEKLTATLASTGTCSHFVHPGEAFHGDLGRFHETDVVIILSRSGETEEIRKILPSLAVAAIPIISITENPDSTLGNASQVVLESGETDEACALGLAPSTSTTVMLGIGDALALTASRLRGFRQEDFARHHPGGSLGRQLAKVRDVMRPLSACRLASPTWSVREVVVQHVPGRGTGAVMLVDEHQRLFGIFTDSDLRRLIGDPKCDLDRSVHEVMTPTPKTVSGDQTAVEAIKVLDAHRISELPVLNGEGEVIGLIDITDLIGRVEAPWSSSSSRDRDQPNLKIRYPEQTNAPRTT